MLEILNFKKMYDIASDKIDRYSRGRVRDIDSSKSRSHPQPNRNSNGSYGPDSGKVLFLRIVALLIFFFGMLLATQHITGEPIFFGD